MSQVASLSAHKAELAMLQKVMEATGLTEDTVTSLVLTNDDLDALCDAILSEFSKPFKKVARFGR